MKNSNYVYSTAEASSFYGLTRKGLAFYEKKGIITPERAENNKYRVYSLRDCYHLYHAKFYSNCDFSLSETAEMLQETSISNFLERMEEKERIIEKEILLKQRTLHHMKRITRIMENLESRSQFQVVSSPEVYRLFVRKYWDEHISSAQQSQEFEEWNQTIPINTVSLKYSLNEIEAGEDSLNVEIGNIISANDFELLGYENSDRVEHIPSQECLYTIIVGGEEDIYQREWLEPAFQYMKEHGLECAGDPFTSMLVVMNSDSGRIRYEEIWFPIKKSKSY